MAGRLAIARPGGAWVLGIHARARGGHRARLRERSAPELTERVTEGPALGTAAHLPRPLARLKHEGGVGRRLAGDYGVVVDDAEVAVEAFMDLDVTAGIGAPTRAARNLHPARPKVHGVVAGHGAVIPTAQEVREIARHRPPGGGGVRGRPRKATSEVREELGQEGVAALERADAAEPQFAGEAILECAPEPFDASLRLRRVGPDEANAKGLQHAAEVRGVLVALELFGQRPVGIIAGEHVEAIAVELQRQAIGPAGALEHGDVAMQILMGTEPQGERCGGRIIDHPMQCRQGAAVLEPGERAGVELGQLAESRFARAPPSRKRLFSRRNCRTLNLSALAPCAFVMRPTSAALSSPARGTSFLLIEKVSIRGYFYRTDREDSSI